MKVTRRYEMGARALAAEETRRRILQATLDLAGDVPLPALTLEKIAALAAVSVQTVLRQFGSRTALFDATIEFARRTVMAERATPPGDVAAAVHTLIDHYELRGGLSLMLLSQEGTDPQVRAATDQAKAMHRDWVRRAFGPSVADHEELLDLLAIATDVYTWKLMRRDRAYTRDLTEVRMLALVEAVLTSQRKELD